MAAAVAAAVQTWAWHPLDVLKTRGWDRFFLATFKGMARMALAEHGASGLHNSRTRKT